MAGVTGRGELDSEGWVQDARLPVLAAAAEAAPLLPPMRVGAALSTRHPSSCSSRDLLFQGYARLPPRGLGSSATGQWCHSTFPRTELDVGVRWEGRSALGKKTARFVRRHRTVNGTEEAFVYATYLAPPSLAINHVVHPVCLPRHMVYYCLI